MKVGELAKVTSSLVETIRFYERTDSNYRSTASTGRITPSARYSSEIAATTS